MEGATPGGATRALVAQREETADRAAENTLRRELPLRGCVETATSLSRISCMPNTQEAQRGQHNLLRPPTDLFTDVAGSPTPWDLHAPNLEILGAWAERFLLTRFDMDASVQCGKNCALSLPACNGAGCIPCFVAFMIWAQHTTHGAQLMYPTLIWKRVLEPQAHALEQLAFGRSAGPLAHSFVPFFCFFYTILIEIMPMELEAIARGGGIRITRTELRALARTQALLETTGKLDPAHLTCRRLQGTNEVAIQVTTDCAPLLLEAWLGLECHPMAWAHDKNAGAHPERTLVAKAILRFLQLTVEGHLGPEGGGTYIPKALAIAIWEHSDAHIRSALPCIGCASMGRSAACCPTASTGCIEGGDNVGLHL